MPGGTLGGDLGAAVAESSISRLDEILCLLGELDPSISPRSLRWRDGSTWEVRGIAEVASLVVAGISKKEK